MGERQSRLRRIAGDAGVKAWVQLIQTGLSSSVQDRGRKGHRSAGMAVSGYLDARLADCANALVGNLEPSVELRGQSAAKASSLACLEMVALGPSIMARGAPVKLAIAGELLRPATLTDERGQTRSVPAWQSFVLQPGQTLAVGAMESVAYLAVQGGWDVAPVMGSRSTHVRSGVGAAHGYTLKAGDTLPCLPAQDLDLAKLASPWRACFAHAVGLAGAAADGAKRHASEWRVRVMPGPQEDHFDAASLTRFYSEGFSVSAERDRMGMRLGCEPLRHTSASYAEIVSEAVVPGSIQVPANGQPVVLLADAQTVGGYPKIATVISADLPLLAHACTGAKLHFVRVDAQQARAALLERERQWQAWALTLREVVVNADLGMIDTERLYSANLISGMSAEP